MNLLQPQDRRSLQPGDTPEAVQSRRRLHELGVTQPLLEGIADLLEVSNEDAVLDAGCGDGFYLGSIAKRHGIDGHGIDISTAAIEAAARRYPQCEWVVANADRMIPYAAGTFSAILSITARRNPAEFRRILRLDGRLLIAVPAPDDFIELRGAGARDRVPGTVQEFAEFFELRKQSRVTTTADLDADSVRDIRHSIYRPLHAEPSHKMRVTFSLDLLLFTILSSIADQRNVS